MVGNPAMSKGGNTFAGGKSALNTRKPLGRQFKDKLGRVLENTESGFMLIRSLANSYKKRRVFAESYSDPYIRGPECQAV